MTAPLTRLPSLFAPQALRFARLSETKRGVTSPVPSISTEREINFDGPYPNHLFAAFIPADSAPIGIDLRSLEGKQICVTGEIALYRGKPKIVVTRKEQIREK